MIGVTSRIGSGIARPHQSPSRRAVPPRPLRPATRPQNYIEEILEHSDYSEVAHRRIDESGLEVWDITGPNAVEPVRNTSPQEGEHERHGRPRARTVPETAERVRVSHQNDGTSERMPEGKEAIVGLPWIRLDTSFPMNPKVLELVSAKKHRAAFAYICGLTYAGGHGTDGFIAPTALPYVHATRRDAADLVDVGLWVPVPGGWQINGWDEKQLSDEAAKRRRERAQKGAAKRWENARRANISAV